MFVLQRQPCLSERYGGIYRTIHLDENRAFRVFVLLHGTCSLQTGLNVSASCLETGEYLYLSSVNMGVETSSGVRLNWEHIRLWHKVACKIISTVKAAGSTARYPEPVLPLKIYETLRPEHIQR